MYLLTPVDGLESVLVKETRRQDIPLRTYVVGMQHVSYAPWDQLLSQESAKISNVKTFGVILIMPNVDVDIVFNNDPEQHTLRNARHVGRLTGIGRSMIVQLGVIDGDGVVQDT